MSQCKACGEPILWVRLQSGKLMPVNFPLKTFVVVSTDTKRGELQKGAEIHFLTCSHPPPSRKKTTGAKNG